MKIIDADMTLVVDTRQCRFDTPRLTCKTDRHDGLVFSLAILTSSMPGNRCEEGGGCRAVKSCLYGIYDVHAVSYANFLFIALLGIPLGGSDPGLVSRGEKLGTVLIGIGSGLGIIRWRGNLETGNFMVRPTA